jgi:hypothetical protein
MSARSRILAVGLAGGAVIGIPSAALAAEDYVGVTPPEVEGNSFSRPPQVQGVTVTREPGLPITGGDIAGMTLLGFGALAAGTVLLRRGRTRAVTA